MGCAICLFNRVARQFHVTVGHSTVIANVTFFGAMELAKLLGAKQDADTTGSTKETAARLRQSQRCEPITYVWICVEY
jgi:hypothetical protein